MGNCKQEVEFWQVLEKQAVFSRNYARFGERSRQPTRTNQDDRIWVTDWVDDDQAGDAVRTGSVEQAFVGASVQAEQGGLRPALEIQAQEEIIGHVNAVLAWEINAVHFDGARRIDQQQTPDILPGGDFSWAGRKGRREGGGAGGAGARSRGRDRGGGSGVGGRGGVRGGRGLGEGRSGAGGRCLSGGRSRCRRGGVENAGDDGCRQRAAKQQQAEQHEEQPFLVSCRL